jgi:hypothetical protein
MLRAIRPADGLRFGLLLLASRRADRGHAPTRPMRADGASAIHGPAYNPPYAALVVDANSGSVLHAANADALRHPASLTKIMTLYMLFEQVEAGKTAPRFADGGLRPRSRSRRPPSSGCGRARPQRRGRDPRAGHEVGERRGAWSCRGDRRR